MKLLIADDEMIERQVLYKILQKNLGEDCAVFQAENGREALKVYEEEKPEVVILDIEMPGIDGIEAAGQIRQQDEDCCIIFLTAYDDFSYAKRAIKVRALDYLLKPCDEQELMLVVEDAIHRRGKDLEMPDERAFLASEEEEDWPEDSGSVRLSQVATLIGSYLQRNYMFDISMQDAARAMNYSDAYFCKLFKQCFDRNFTSYLNRYRINEAKKMLKHSTANVKEIGKAVGYSNSNYFAKVFKRIEGQSPKEYRLDLSKK